MRSIAKTRPAPSIHAAVIANWPTGPQPNTATELPGSISASDAPKYAVGKISESKIAWSSETSSGSFTGPTLANGMRANSACSPWNGPVGLGPPKNAVPACGPFGFATSHCEKVPWRQNMQAPQPIVDGMTTRSPLRRLRTPLPTSSTTPTPSWPKIVPGTMPANVPRTMCRSVPQIALDVSRTIASVGSSSLGSGTVSSRMSPMP